MPETRAQIEAVGLVVGDMARTVAFYRAVGVDIPDGAEGEGHVEARLSGGFRIMFDTVEVVSSFSDYVPPAGGRPMSLAVRCGTAREVDEIYHRLTDAGHIGRHAPFDAFWGQRYATVLDPDGNPVDLYAPLE